MTDEATIIFKDANENNIYVMNFMQSYEDVNLSSIEVTNSPKKTDAALLTYFSLKTTAS